jgi:ribose/xylose/arabinose/galactoside ABC-type transport system permease subunit
MTQPQTQTQRQSPVMDILGSYGIHLVLLALIVVTAILSPAFLTGNNISNMLLQAAPLGIVVIGQVFVILVRGLDLSVASVMATAAVVATSFSGQNTDALPVFFVAIAIGLVTGLVNGLLITKRNVSPFLATLATMTLLQGIRFAYTQGAP